MSEQRSLSRTLASFLSRPRRWATGGISALCITGMVLTGLATPASADELPSNVKLEQWADFSGNWVTGALGVNGNGASRYSEGETVPFRLEVTSAGAGSFEFSVCRDYANGSDRGYLSLEPYNTSRSGVDLGVLTVTHAATGPAQPFSGAAVVGGVSVDSVHEVGGPGNCGAGLRETQVEITISTGPGGVGPVGAYVLWGGRLASPADAGVGPANGASQFPGGSLSMRLGGSAKNVGIKTAAIIQLGTITVQKVVDSGTAGADQFCFTIDPNPAGVALPVCPVLDAGSTSSATASFVALPTGSYTVSEVGFDGYSFASGLGSTANCTISAGVATASVVAANTPTDATCVFHNRRQTGTLTINQIVDPADDPGRFNLQIDGTTAGTGADVGHGGTTGAITVSSGAHGVGVGAGTDTDLADYSASVACATAGGTSVAVVAGQVSVADGQDIVCTVTLTRGPIVITDPPTTTTTTGSEGEEEEEETTTTTTSGSQNEEESTTTTTTSGSQNEDEEETTTTTTTSPSVDPTTDEDDEPVRCASSRTKPRTKECDGGNDPVVDTNQPSDVAPEVDAVTTVAGGGDDARPVPVDQVLGEEVDRPAPAAAPAPAPDSAPAPLGGMLPRTGSVVGAEVTLALGLIAAGLALLWLNKRRPAPIKG